MKDAATLSTQETKIAELIAWGAAKKQIASRLFISTRTVENHTRSIFKKVGVTKSNELSAWWFCTHYKVPFTESPLIKRIAGIILLMTFSTTAKVIVAISLTVASLLS